MIKKKLIVLNTALMLGVGSLVTVPEAFAQPKSSEISKIEKSLSETRDQLKDLEAQIKRVDLAIKDNDKLIIKTEEEIAIAAEEVKALELEVAELEKNISSRTEILKGRVLALQETGGNVRYIDVLFGSKGFSDFVDRLFAVVQIANADTELVNEQEADKSLFEEKRVIFDEKLFNLENQKIELEGMKEHILEQKKKNDSLKKELEKKESEDLTKKTKIEEEIAAAEAAARRNAAPQVSRGSSAPTSNNISFNNNVSYTGDVSTVISAGQKYIGRSAYKFGGGRTQSDLINGLFDCSGFVSWAYRQAGISIPASTNAVRNVGTRVSVNDMRPGDLVFFNTYKTDGHVGIYIGGGKFIGSQNTTGVAIADMTSGYWKSKFNGRVNRIIN